MSTSLDDALRALAIAADLVRDGRLGGVRLQLGELRIDVESPRGGPAVPADEDATAGTARPGPSAAVSAITAPSVTAPSVTVSAVTAPLMGVFFRAPAPDQPPFVKVSQRVEAGQQIAVIEAMKLMNPVLADRPGVVREVHVADGEVVEFEQPLISIEPA